MSSMKVGLVLTVLVCWTSICGASRTPPPCDSVKFDKMTWSQESDSSPVLEICAKDSMTADAKDDSSFAEFEAILSYDDGEKGVDVVGDLTTSKCANFRMRDQQISKDEKRYEFIVYSPQHCSVASARFAMTVKDDTFKAVQVSLHPPIYRVGYSGKMLDRSDCLKSDAYLHDKACYTEDLNFLEKNEICIETSYSATDGKNQADEEFVQDCQHGVKEATSSAEEVALVISALVYPNEGFFTNSSAEVLLYSRDNEALTISESIIRKEERHYKVVSCQSDLNETSCDIPNFTKSNEMYSISGVFVDQDTNMAVYYGQNTITDLNVQVRDGHDELQLTFMKYEDKNMYTTTLDCDLANCTTISQDLDCSLVPEGGQCFGFLPVDVSAVETFLVTVQVSDGDDTNEIILPFNRDPSEDAAKMHW